jgi:hypothetical protein
MISGFIDELEAMEGRPEHDQTTRALRLRFAGAPAGDAGSPCYSASFAGLA